MEKDKDFAVQNVYVLKMVYGSSTKHKYRVVYWGFNFILHSWGFELFPLVCDVLLSNALSYYSGIRWSDGLCVGYVVHFE